MKSNLQFLTVVLAAVWLGSSLSGATLVVDLNDGADYTDIQSAIDAAANGDTVLVKPGEYVIAEPINFNRLHDPENPASPPVKNIIVKSEAGQEVTAIRMSETPANPGIESVMVFEKGETGASVVDGFLMSGGTGCRDPFGGSSGGGLYCYRSSPTLTNCTISENTSFNNFGGGIFCFLSSPMLTNCTISGNSCVNGGGGIACHASSPILTNCKILGNVVLGDMTDAGGGLYCNSESSPTLMNCTISSNRAVAGGGVNCNAESCPTLSNCTISANLGDGMYCSESCPKMISCTISGNTETGVLCTQNSSPALSNCTISGNTESGVLCTQNSSPALSNCTISGNSAGKKYEIPGGGLSCIGSSPMLTSCTISGNTSVYDGGGVYCSFSAPILTNCTIAGNFAGRQGGGVCCYLNSAPTLINCTISANLGPPGCAEDCSPTLTNCIVLGNSPESVCGTLSHCLTDQNPLFVDPGHWDDNGTPDDPSDDKWIPGDYHLQPGSPAIDAGTPEGAPSTDIEGKSRPCGAGVDIGSYEFGDCGAPARFIRGDSNADGAFDISDPVATLGFLFLGTKAPDCLDAADSNDSGVVDLSDAVYSLGFLFLGGVSIPQPFPDCGTDITLDDLTCVSFSPCPAVGQSHPLPATGQTKCNGEAEGQGWVEVPCESAEIPGQDGAYQAGCPMAGRFVDHGDGTVTDTCTGLMWQKDTGNGGSSLSWPDAIEYCENLDFAGLDDWRLPNIRELQSIVDYGRAEPAIDPVFGASSVGYWSSTFELREEAVGGAMGWGVNYERGFVGYPGNEVYHSHVRAVRGAGNLPATGQADCYGRFIVDQGWVAVPCEDAEIPGQDGTYQAGCPMAGRFVDHGDGTVTDTCTGLMWQKDTADVNGDGVVNPPIDGGDALTWRDAPGYCEGLIFAGHDDWRLPNVRELLSIVDYGRRNPAIDPIFGADSGWYWSSTLYVPPYEWIVHFGSGFVGNDIDWDSQFLVRAVRNEQ